MGAGEDFIEHLSRVLPEMLTSKDLVKIGLYKTEQGAASARRGGTCPEYFQINARKVIYPKKGVIEFLKKKLVKPTRFKRPDSTENQKVV